MQEQIISPDSHERIYTVEYALDLLCNGKPKGNEKTHIFVNRCVSILQGRQQRAELKRAIMESLNELGIRAVDPATSAQAILNATLEGTNEPA